MFLEPSRYGTISSLVLDGMLLPQAELGHNLGVLLDSQFLTEKQVTAMARRVFAQLCCAPFLDFEALLTVTLALVTLHRLL